MENNVVKNIKEKLIEGWQNLIRKSDEETIAGVGRERIVVFIVALILALCLWLMVNLSRDYNLNIDLPITLSTVPTDKALAQNLPKTATVSVNGEGWKLINLYNNPPKIPISISDSEVNLYDQVQQQMNALPSINLQKVQPLILTLDLEDRISKKVPVRQRVDIAFQDQYDFVGQPTIQPDSVTISGASSLVQKIDEWVTDSVTFRGIFANISQVVPLQSPGELITLSEEEVQFNARVAEYTEGEAKVAIQTRDLPPSRKVNYSPSSITVKYDIPLMEYTEIKDRNPFDAFVTYQQIESDSTGFVTPQIEQAVGDYHIQIRSFQPRRAAYFMVLDDQ